jgi:hypothetical protein
MPCMLSSLGRKKLVIPMRSILSSVANKKLEKFFHLHSSPQNLFSTPDRIYRQICFEGNERAETKLSVCCALSDDNKKRKKCRTNPFCPGVDFISCEIHLHTAAQPCAAGKIFTEPIVRMALTAMVWRGRGVWIELKAR